MKEVIVKNLFLSLEQKKTVDKVRETFEEGKDLIEKLIGADPMINFSNKKLNIIDDYALLSLTAYSLLQAGELNNDNDAYFFGELILESIDNKLFNNNGSSMYI